MLTGQTELELPEARAEMGDKAQHVDVYPFIWKEYKEQGYLTGKVPHFKGNEMQNMLERQIL